MCHACVLNLGVRLFPSALGCLSPLGPRCPLALSPFPLVFALFRLDAGIIGCSFFVVVMVARIVRQWRLDALSRMAVAILAQAICGFVTFCISLVVNRCLNNKSIDIIDNRSPADLQISVSVSSK